MRLPFVAKIKLEGRPHFISPWEVIAFVIGVVVILMLIFPQETLRETLSKENKPSVVTEMYLQNVVHLYPKNLKLALLLAQQQLDLGELDEAEHTIKKINPALLSSKSQPEYAWMYYRLKLKQAYALTPDSEAQKEAFDELKSSLKQFETMKLTPEETYQLGKDALALNAPSTATVFFKQLSTMPGAKKFNWEEEAANAALWSKDYKGAAEFYAVAMNNAKTLEQKRNYYMKTLKTYQAGNLVNDAIEFAQKNYNAKFMDKATLEYLSKLALAANRPDLAQQYYLLSMHIQDNQPDTAPKKQQREAQHVSQ